MRISLKSSTTAIAMTIPSLCDKVLKLEKGAARVHCKMMERMTSMEIVYVMREVLSTVPSVSGYRCYVRIVFSSCITAINKLSQSNTYQLIKYIPFTNQDCLLFGYHLLFVIYCFKEYTLCTNVLRFGTLCKRSLV